MSFRPDHAVGGRARRRRRQALQGHGPVHRPTALAGAQGRADQDEIVAGQQDQEARRHRGRRLQEEEDASQTDRGRCQE